jgi:hypothetical protein
MKSLIRLEILIVMTRVKKMERRKRKMMEQNLKSTLGLNRLMYQQTSTEEGKVCI